MKSWKVVTTNMTGHVASVVVPSHAVALGIVSSFMQRKHSISVYPTDEPVTHKNSYAADAYLQVAEILPVARASAPAFPEMAN